MVNLITQYKYASHKSSLASIFSRERKTKVAEQTTRMRMQAGLSLC